jgi:predicted nucleotidyltransferase component of viral defense system
MIPHREIIAWRAHAPWARDAQVEQDLLLTKAMAAIFADSFLRTQVAMRGGTALHKVHLMPASRYSEDIDLVLVGERPPNHVSLALRRVLEPLLGRPRTSLWTTAQLAVRNFAQPSKIQRVEYVFSPTVPPPNTAKIKVEFNVSERTPFYDLVTLDYAPPLPETAEPVALRSYDLDEMLGTKMRALLQRDQGRDLFDLWLAWERSRSGVPSIVVDPDRVVAAFQDYMRRENTIVTAAEFRRALQGKLQKPSFRADMTALLRPEHASYDVDAAGVAVDAVFLSRLP